MVDVDSLLLGKHQLNAVLPDCAHPFKSDGRAIAVELDDKLFLFLEDDNEDHRSALGAVLVAGGSGGSWSRTRINRTVLVSKATNSRYAGAHDDVYEFRDAETGKLGLRIGTEDIDDYYPSFVVEYDASAWNSAAETEG